MTTYTYIPHSVCSEQITFDLESGKLHNVRVVGGCDGNLRAIGKLLEGADAAHTVRTLKGNDCNGRGTSCADQLAIAIERALQQETAQ